MTGRIVQLYKRKKRKIKQRIDRAFARVVMRRRFITDAYYHEKSDEIGIVRRALYLLLLCLASAVGKVYSHRAAPAERRDYTNHPFYKRPESRACRRPSYTAMAKKLLLCDVVSFDVFDTLLLRPFDDPKAVFYLVGEQLHCPSFFRYRVLAEKQARKEAMGKTGSNEVTLQDIYKKLRRYVACDIEKAIRIEEETELSLLQFNPYMKEIYHMALNLNKTIIAVTDMYLSGDIIKKALHKNGYTEISHVFLSQECGFSKRSGRLFPYVKEKIGTEKTYLHIGDNYTADVLAAKEAGLQTCYYPNVDRLGNPHRAADLTALIGSAYRGVLNNRLCCGAYRENQYFEYGYAYAGFYILGYCVWIHERVKAKGIDTLLFLSRDGDILQKAYQMLYPKENTQYVYWSRAAATRLTAGYFRNEFFLRYIKYKISRKITMHQMLKAMELPDMQPVLEKAGFPKDMVLTQENYEQIVAVFLDNWHIVENAYAKSFEAAKKYYREKLSGARCAAAVDVGWAASGVSALKVLVEDLWKLDCKIYGFISGANYIHDQNIIEAPLTTGDIESYMFSQQKNRELKRRHRVGQLYSVLIEMMLASPTPSFLQYEEGKDGQPGFCFDLPEVEGYEKIRALQQGVLQFIEAYTQAFKKYPYMYRICGEDAYHVCRFIISRPKYFRNLFSDCPVNRTVGTSSHTMETLQDLFDKEFKK